MKKYDRSFRTVMPNKRKQRLNKDKRTHYNFEEGDLVLIHAKPERLEHFISFAQGPFKALKKKTFITS